MNEPEPRTESAQSTPADEVSTHTATRQQIIYCPYCAEETLFPLERGWECRSCGRAFSITFLGLRWRGSAAGGSDTRDAQP